MTNSFRTLSIDGSSLTLDSLASLLRGGVPRLRLTPKARQAVERSRRAVEEKIRSGATVYGVNTGFGKLARVRIEEKDLRRLQRNLILSHATGTGPTLPVPETRLLLLLRINALAKGFSGVRLKLLQTLIAIFESGIVPLIPEQGSVGASGDLAPLAHLAMIVLGEGEALNPRGRRMPAIRALRNARIRELELEAKEGLALINGTQMMTAIGASVCLRARRLAKLADATGALTLEALKGSPVPFDPRIAMVRQHPGHAATAANLRRCLAGSQVIPSHKNCEKVQDPYSLRCMPQVHGASKEGIEFAAATIEREMNAATDNPLVFSAQGDILSGGNFHGQPVSAALDTLGIAIATLANISERRIENMVNPDLSGLPAFLTAKSGINSGFMIPQVVAAALVSENKIYAHPASVDSIPTSANKEDHVSMGVAAARKARAILENAERVIAIELLCAAQGREFAKGLRAGKGAEAAYKAVRKLVPALHEDRFLAPDIEKIRKAVVSGEILAAVESAVGELRV